MSSVTDQQTHSPLPFFNRSPLKPVWLLSAQAVRTRALRWHVYALDWVLCLDMAGVKTFVYFVFMPDKIVGPWWWSFLLPKAILHNSHCSVVVSCFMYLDSKPDNLLDIIH